MASFFIVFMSKNPKKHISCKSFINNDLKLRIKEKKTMFKPFKQYFFIITVQRTHPYHILKPCVRQTHMSFTSACDCIVNTCKNRQIL